MKSDRKILRATIIILAILSQIGMMMTAANRRHLTTHEGLSNMAVLSFMQDNEGYMWVATCDGVDVVESNRIRNYAVGNNGRDEFSGNLVEWIQQDRDGVLWVHTNYGLDRYDPRADRIDYFRDINGTYRDALAPDGEMVVMVSSDSLLYCGAGERRFVNIGKPPFILHDVKLMRFDDDNTLNVVTRDGFYKSVVTGKERNPEFRQVLREVVRSARLTEGHLMYLTDDFELKEYDFSTGTGKHIYQFDDLLRRRGELSSVALDRDGYVLGFKTNGAVRLREVNGEMRIEPLGIESGVFALYRDPVQDILWVGTDGDGIYCYSKDAYEFGWETRTSANSFISKPVRCLFKDAEGSVWIGTKGDGVYCYRNFRPGMKVADVEHHTMADSGLPDNEIYAFASSRRPLFWIGGQGWGLSYYSYTDHRIHYLDVPSPYRLQSVHGICEADASTLYLATVGEGALRVSIGGESDHPVIKDVSKVIFDGVDTDANSFFSVTPGKNGEIWFGNRGYGAYRYDSKSGGRVTRIDFSSIMPVANDVFDIYQPQDDSGRIYCATSAGLIEAAPDNEGKFDFKVALTPTGGARTIHAILAGRKGEILASTNSGLVRYRLDGDGATYYSSGTDFPVMQFNDGAAYRDEESGTLYFGGANGFVVAIPSPSGDFNYDTAVNLRSMTIGDEVRPGVAALDSEGRLVLGHHSNNFKLLFSAPDYLNGSHGRFRYRLDGASDAWVDSPDGEVIFTNISHGKYTLEVSYSNGGAWSEPYRLPIVIKPPFYASTAAYVIYGVVCVGIVIALLMMTVRYQERKRKRIVEHMEQKGREDVYEAKLRFFTNITHELFTPLTLINGACERMLCEIGDRSRDIRLTRSIHKNSTRLTELIQELIEFRRIDTDHRQPDVEMLDVSEIAADAVDNFSILAEQRELNLKADITPAMEWPSDRSGFVTIVNNLLSNALKYTPKGGEIRVELRKVDENLIFKVANTGEGIAPENLNKIFDRYKVLERFERLSAEGTIRRNGLGLAVCDGLARLLKGSITVESVQGEWTTFTVTLPRIEVTRSVPAADHIHYEKTVIAEELVDDAPEDSDKDKEGKMKDKNLPLVYVIDDEREMLSFISDTLSGDYRVVTFTDAREALKAIDKEWPDAIICDILMEGMSGIEFVGKVKAVKATSHIPVVQLSSLHSEEDKIKSLNSGADVYVTKPFRMGYLRTVVGNIIKRKESLKEYYDSAMSAYKRVEGQVVHEEDRQFLDRMRGIIEENLSNPALDTKFVADTLGMSIRNLYRKLDTLTDRTPNVIIKEIRIESARKMLEHTNDSIEEVLYRAGFTNRGTFFKHFQQKFGCTPKQYREQCQASAKNVLEPSASDSTDIEPTE